MGLRCNGKVIYIGFYYWVYKISSPSAYEDLTQRMNLCPRGKPRVA